MVFNATFSNISAISWWPVLVVEEAGSTRREPPTMGKQLVNFITCGCESCAPFFVIIYPSGFTYLCWDLSLICVGIFHLSVLGSRPSVLGSFTYLCWDLALHIRFSTQEHHDQIVTYNLVSPWYSWKLNYSLSIKVMTRLHYSASKETVLLKLKEKYVKINIQ
jgi:hypothetical protein